MPDTYKSIPIRYRPKVLDDVIGQDTVISQLRGMLKAGKIPGTLIVDGPFGSGKTTVARLIARYVNCLDPQGDSKTPCGSCESCTRLDRNAHPDVQEMNAADTRGIDTVRNLNEVAKYKPQTNYRVFILDEMHQLTDAAVQALLKITEEPPASTIFIFCTTEPNRVPRAMMSRATRLRIVPIPPEETAELLSRVAKTEEQPLPDEIYMQIAKAVHGHPRDALTVLESAINVCRDKGPEADLSEFIAETIRDIVGEPLEILAKKFLVSVYQGKYVGAIKAIQSGKDYNALLDSILKYHAQAIYYTLGDKLRDSYYTDFYVFLKKRNIYPIGDVPEDGRILSFDVLTQITDILVTAGSDLKQYMVDGFYVMLNAAMRSATLSRKAIIAAKSE